MVTLPVEEAVAHFVPCSDVPVVNFLARTRDICGVTEIKHMEEVIDATPDSIRGDEALIERQTGLDVIHTLPAFRSISSDIICLRTAAGWRGIRVLSIEGNI